MTFDNWLELLEWLDLEGQAAAAWAQEQGRVLDSAVAAFDAKRAAAAAAVDLAGAARGVQRKCNESV